MLVCYFILPRWPNINILYIIIVDRERFSVFREITESRILATYNLECSELSQ